MADYDELSARRFDKAEDPKDTPLLSALDAAKKAVSEGVAEHVIIILGKSFEDGSSHTRFLQAGTYGAHAQEGLVYAGLRLIGKSGASR